MLYGRNLRNSVNPRVMRPKQYLTSFRQGKRSVDEWYNTAQTQVAFAKYPQETAKILHRDIFWFFSEMRSLCQKPSMTVTLI